MTHRQRTVAFSYTAAKYPIIPKAPPHPQKNSKTTMATQATLSFTTGTTESAESYKVADMQISTTRHHTYGIPDGDARCREMKLAFVAPSDCSKLHLWYIEHTEKDGTIVTEDGRTITFERATCYGLTETYDADQAEGQRLHLTLYVAPEKVVTYKTEK